MFRPNRIGTPYFNQTTTVDNTAALTINSNNATLPNVTGHAINASPVADFGVSNLTWDGPGTTFTAAQKFALFQQFTVEQPLAGDAVGFEVNASLDIQINGNCLIVPVLTKLAAAGGAVLANVQSGAGIHALRMRTPLIFTPATAQNWAAISQTNQVVFRDTTSVAGTFGHGFLIYARDTTNMTISGFHMSASVRQLNDQENVNYRDTLR